MSDDFGTINVSRAERAREIEIMRAHYRRHRETLAKLIADAPTEHLANEYQRVIKDIDASMLKLDELEGRGTAPIPAAAPEARTTPERLKTDAGSRPLVTTAQPADDTYAYTQSDSDSRSRLTLIIVAAVVALALVAWLIWRASSDRRSPATGTVVDTSTAVPATSVTEEPPGTVAPVATATLAVSPRNVDYGTIIKGTRATRQVEVTNQGDQPVTIQVARSACRCLYYEYTGTIAPKGKETVTMTIDGAKAKAGALRESVKISAKSDPSIATSVDLTATIR